MAGFEVIVRPVVFPNIRPAPTRSLPPADDPTKGLCVIHGSGGQLVDLPQSWSASSSKSRPIETRRRVDEVQIYQEEDDGKVNKKNFIKAHVANKIWTVDPSVGTIQGDVFIPGGSKGAKGTSYETATYYARQLEQRNIEIKNRDIIQKNPDAPQ